MCESIGRDNENTRYRRGRMQSEIQITDAGKAKHEVRCLAPSEHATGPRHVSLVESSNTGPPHRVSQLMPFRHAKRLGGLEQKISKAAGPVIEAKPLTHTRWLRQR